MNTPDYTSLSLIALALITILHTSQINDLYDRVNDLRAKTQVTNIMNCSVDETMESVIEDSEREE